MSPVSSFLLLESVSSESAEVGQVYCLDWGPQINKFFLFPPIPPF
jgi:hypothetical protein